MVKPLVTEYFLQGVLEDETPKLGDVVTISILGYAREYRIVGLKMNAVPKKHVDLEYMMGNTVKVDVEPI